MKTQRILVASRYRILRELGRGAVGIVYVAEHVGTGDRLALKVLQGAATTDALAVERFRREARASARIGSEHVVKVVDAGVAPELEGAPFLVMELLDGQDLEAVLAERRRLPPTEAVDVLAQVARALDRSHALGIVHRDLKPANVFLHRREDGSRIVKVLDFGTSKVLRPQDLGDGDGGITRTGTIMGTPLYMAPEQARGDTAQIGAAADVWAIGQIAVRLLTGEVYWTATGIADLFVQIACEPMPPPTRRWPWLPAAFDAWFARSCDRDPSRRFRSVGEQVELLAAALGVPTVSTTMRPHALGHPAPAGASGPRAAAMASVIVAGLLTMLGGIWVARGHAPQSVAPPSRVAAAVIAASSASFAASSLVVAPAATAPAPASVPAAPVVVAAPAKSAAARPPAAPSGPPHRTAPRAWPYDDPNEDPFIGKP